MRFRRAMMALVVSAMVSLIPVLMVEYLVFGVGLLDIEFDATFSFLWKTFGLEPVFCWFIIVLPLLLLTRFFDRRPWYWSGLFGLLAGVAGAFLYRVFQQLTGLEWQPLFITIIWAPLVAIQFVVVSLTKRWASAATRDPVETNSG